MKKVQDYYFHQAKKQNYSARSVFKLKEINDKYHLIKKGMRVLDLGASPGSWVEYTSEQISSQGSIVAIDLKPLETKNTPQLHFIQGNITDPELSNHPILQEKMDIILSDMAPNTSGNKGLDHQISIELCSEVLKYSDRILKDNQNLIMKAFQGEDLQEFLNEEVKPRFQKYKIFKPKSSRKESVELFIICFNKLSL